MMARPRRAPGPPPRSAPPPLEFRLLGSLEVRRGGTLVSVGGPKQRAVLAILLLHANHVVATERLADKLWAGEPPPSATVTLQSHISGLRRALGAGADDGGFIVTRPPGYVIEVDPGQLDVTRFEAEMARGQEALAVTDWAAAAAAFRRALELWRGPALADFAYEEFAQAEAARLEEARLRVFEHRVEADLALGRHAELVGELESLVAVHPLREGLWGQLMTALYRCGRQGEALRAYQRVRQALSEELGIDPTPALQRLETAILRQDPALDHRGEAASSPPPPSTTVEVVSVAEAGGRPPSGRPTVAGSLVDGAALFVGRRSELAVLEAELARAGGGEARCVLLTGEAGVGKTRLATELAARHTGEILSLSGRGYHLGLTASFSVWAEALERHLRRLPADAVVEVCGGFLDDLATLLRTVAAVRGSVPENAPPSFRVLQGLALLLARLAEDKPVVIVLDDIHLADASSWDELQYVMGNVPEARLLVVAAGRPGELAEQPLAAEVLHSLEQEGFLARLKLAALEAETIGELAEAVLGRSAPQTLSDWLVERSQGNTLFALTLLRAVVQEGADLSAPALTHIPESLAERVAARLTRLDQPTLAILETLAALGRRVDVATLATVTRIPFETLAGGLAQLVRARLVAEDERDRDVTYEVTHPLIQEAIYEGISAARRQAAHRLIGRALLAGGRLGEAAAHFARSAHVGDDEAISALSEAVREAERRGAYREAVIILSALAELLPSGDDRWLEVAGVLSRQADWVYRGPSAEAMSIRALREIEAVLERSADPAQQATINFRLANFLAYGSGELDEAAAACRRAVDLYRRAGDAPGALLAANELASIRGLGGDLAAWQAGCREVVDAAEAAGDPFVLVQALGALGTVAAHRGRFDEAEAAQRRNLAVIGKTGKPHRRTMGLTALAYCLAGQGRMGEALPLLEEAKAGDPRWRESLFEWGIAVAWMAGDFRSVIGYADQIGPVGKRSAHALHFAALAAAETGQLPRARSYLARADTAYAGGEWFFYSDYGRYVDAVLAWRVEPTAAAVAAVRRVGERLLALQVLPYAAWVLVDLAEMAASGGEPAVARWAAHRLEEIAAEIDRPLYAGVAGIAAGWAGLASGDSARPCDAAGEAVASLSKTGCRAFSARAVEVLAHALGDVDSDAAEAAYREAAAAFDACGARWRAERCRAVLGS
jgi:DNA-binding SARP family transcriptional activator